MRALLSVSDKTGLIDFARGLRECGVELIATSSTGKALSEAGIEALSVADITGFPEMLDGRVRTLHPAIHAGILARRDIPEHMRQLAENKFDPIDLVVSSLYPFADTLASGADDETIIENIDIGGPTLIRAAAKNRDSVAVVVSPRQYDPLLTELREHGSISVATRHRLAVDAFAHVAAYDTQVAAWLRTGAASDAMPAEFTVGGPRLHELRYGENPHQRGALYASPGKPGGAARARSLQGSALSFTNWLDVDAARALVSEFDEPAACVIKHTNPCGFAVGEDAVDAYRRAYECDPRAAYGGIVGINRPIDLATANELARTFLEAVVCPGIDDDAAAHLATKPRLRVLVVDRPSSGWGVRRPQHRRWAARTDARSRDHRPVDDDGCEPAPARRTRVARPAHRLAGVPPCQVERSCRRARRHGRRRRRRSDVARRIVRAGSGKSRRSRRGCGRCLRRLLPDARRSRGARQRGRPRGHSSRGSKNDPVVTEAADRVDMVVVFAGERHFRH